ncbi:tetratricopeptide repeat protein [Pontibacter sp. CAU 1760]
MKKILLAVIAFACATSLSMAQVQPVKKDIEVLPMFGGLPKSDEQQRKDEKFLTSCDKSFASRQEASKFFVTRAWEYLNEGQVDTAMYRFNLAWLLNPDNKDTHWAFGLVTSAQGDDEKAIEFYEKALTLDARNSMLLSDMATSYLNLYSNGKKKKKHLKKARHYLEESITADAANSFALFNLSKVKFFEKKYSEAWDYLHQSRAINLTHIDYEYLALLTDKMPDPQGFFRSGVQPTSSN